MDPVTDSSLPPTEFSDFDEAGSADEEEGEGATVGDGATGRVTYEVGE